jgi:anaerobic magnesium-protoporphyrin IX monomethyl ester cyclase
LLSILVAHSYFQQFDEKQRLRAKPYPPLMTIQVAAMLRRAGHDISLFDAMLARGLDDFSSILDAVDPRVLVIYEDNYNFLSKMCLGKMRNACLAMIGKARASGARVIVAGSDATDAPLEYLSAGADAVLRGEGLATLQALIDRINRDANIEIAALVAGLPDLVSLESKAESAAHARAPVPVPELDSCPAWDLIDIEAYRNVWMKAHGYFSLNMAASRGCSFRCNWCAKPIWGNRYLQRDASHIANEMIYLKNAFQAEHVWFADDIFGFRADWVSEFARVLQLGGGGIPFTIQLRADLVSNKMAAALKEAGCREVWIGAESGSQKILDQMNKGTTVAEIVHARELLAEQDIRVGFFLMLGYPGEGIEELLATRDLLSTAKPDDVGVSVAYPLAGTKFHDTVREELGAQINWNESKDLSMMFRGTYRSEFYHILRDLLHDQATEGLSPDISKRWQRVVAHENRYRQDAQIESIGQQSVQACRINSA